MALSRLRADSGKLRQETSPFGHGGIAVEATRWRPIYVRACELGRCQTTLANGPGGSPMKANPRRMMSKWARFLPQTDPFRAQADCGRHTEMQTENRTGIYRPSTTRRW